MENWEKEKSKQSNYLQRLYPEWAGNYDGSRPAVLVEFMNTSYEIGRQEERDRILKELPKEVRNDEIEKFKCYNTEGNIRMQDGFNYCLKQIKDIILNK